MLGVVSKTSRLQRIPNSSVEIGAVTPDDWYYGGQAFWSEAEAHTGKKSLLINVSAQTGEWRCKPFDVKVGAKYHFEAYFIGTVESGEFFLTIRWFRKRGGEDFISEYNIAIPVGSYADWTKFSGEYTAPSEAVSADVLFRVPTSSTGTVYGDDFICFTEPYTEWRYAMETVSSPIILSMNPADPYEHAMCYIYRVKQFAPVKLGIVFKATGPATVDVYDAENNRWLVPEATEITETVSFEVDWDGRGVVEPRVYRGEVSQIEIHFYEPEVRMRTVRKSLDFGSILAAFMFIIMARFSVNLIRMAKKKKVEKKPVEAVER